MSSIDFNTQLLSLQAPVVVDPKSLTEKIDLLSANDHLTHSEVCP